MLFPQKKKYNYQNEFRIVALNAIDEPLTNLYVDIAPNQLQFLELRNAYDFICKIDLKAQEIENICAVYYDISCFLSDTNE